MSPRQGAQSEATPERARPAATIDWPTAGSAPTRRREDQQRGCLGDTAIKGPPNVGAGLSEDASAGEGGGPGDRVPGGGGVGQVPLLPPPAFFSVIIISLATLYYYLDLAYNII